MKLAMRLTGSTFTWLENSKRWERVAAVDGKPLLPPVGQVVCPHVVDVGATSVASYVTFIGCCLPGVTGLILVVCV